MLCRLRNNCLLFHNPQILEEAIILVFPDKIIKVTWGNFGNGVISGILSSDDYNPSLLPAIQWYQRANNVQTVETQPYIYVAI